MSTFNRLRTHALFAAMGLVATASQIILMCRFIVLFGGNELVAGGVFAGWLGFSAAGNLVMSRFADRVRDAWRASGLLLCALAISVPATVAASYLIKPALGIPAPIMLGPGAALALSALLMAPIGLIIGASFTMCGRLPIEQDASSVPRVYLMDAIGSGLGGLAVSLFAIRYLTCMQQALMAASIMLLAVGLSMKRVCLKLAALAMLAAVSALMFASLPVQMKLVETLWRGFDPKVQMESLYSSLMVTANRGERTLFVDGRPAFSLPMGYTYEASANLPLLQHGSPKDVAMIEGGLSGTLEQWEKWGLESAYFLRLDPDVTHIEENSMPSAIADLPDWMHLVQTDGRRFIRSGRFGSCEGGCLDVLAVNVGEPDTAATDRYYTRQFFEEAKAALRDDGVLALWMLEPQNAIGEETAKLLGGLQATLKAVFPRVVMLPLDRFYFFATREGAVTDDVDELIARLDSSGVESPYLADQVLAGIYQERVDDSAAVVQKASERARVNEDRRPGAYFNAMLLWEKRFGSGSRLLAKIAAASNPWLDAAILVAIALASVAVAKLRRRRTGPLLALYATGFASMSYEIALLVHYQMRMGVMLYSIGFIITSFMVGAGLGAYAGIRLKLKPKRSERALAIAMAILAALSIAMFWTTQVSFLVSNLAAGLLCGFIYQAAAGTVFRAKGATGITAGRTEFADHSGAVVGSIVTSLVVIPTMGLFAPLWLAAATLLISAAVLLSGL